MPTLTQGLTGTLRFLPESAGLSAAVVTSVAWQPQGGQQAVRFTAPDQVEGLAPGTGDYKCTVTMGPGEKAVYAFTITCIAPVTTVPIEAPVTIVIAAGIV